MKNISPIPFGPHPERTSLMSGVDYYKPVMSQHAHEREPNAEVTFTFKNRGKQRLMDYVSPDELQARFDLIRERGFTPEELDHLASQTNPEGQRVFSDEYLQHLATVQLPEAHVTVADDDLAIETTGTWDTVTFWETIVMSELNERYFDNYVRQNNLDIFEVYEEGDRRLSEKIAILQQHPDIKIADFGTRRHFSYQWHRHVLERLKAECPDNLLGTSNVAMARALDLPPSGTLAHEMPMVYAGLADSRGQDIRQSHKQFLNDWMERYGPGSATTLTDTFTSEFFFSDFTPDQARQWRSLRQDSGDPVAYGEQLLQFYQNLGIDPATKTLVFSDGLDIDQIVALHKRFKGRINTVFGWGTTLTNDLDIPPLNIVMKATHVNGQETVKLSDNPGKHTGSPNMIRRYRHVFRVASAEDPQQREAESKHANLTLLEKKTIHTYPKYPTFFNRLSERWIKGSLQRPHIPAGSWWVNPDDYERHVYPVQTTEGVTHYDSYGRALHPWYREMLANTQIGAVAGLGGYWYGGPNIVRDSIIVRRDLHEPHVLLIKRKDTGEWAFPGGYGDEGEDKIATAIRETKEESFVDLSQLEHTPQIVYEGLIADPRMTLHAWPVTTAVRFELSNRSASTLPTGIYKGGDDAELARWAAVSDIHDLFGGHMYLLERSGLK